MKRCFALAAWSPARNPPARVCRLERKKSKSHARKGGKQCSRNQDHQKESVDPARRAGRPTDGSGAGSSDRDPLPARSRRPRPLAPLKSSVLHLDACPLSPPSVTFSVFPPPRTTSPPWDALAVAPQDRRRLPFGSFQHHSRIPECSREGVVKRSERRAVDFPRDEPFGLCSFASHVSPWLPFILSKGQYKPRFPTQGSCRAIAPPRADPDRTPKQITSLLRASENGKPCQSAVILLGVHT